MLKTENLLNQELPNPPTELWDETELIEKLSTIKTNPTAQYNTVFNPDNLTDGATYDTVQLYGAHTLSVENLSAYIDLLITAKENGDPSAGYVELGQHVWLAVSNIDIQRYGGLTIDSGSITYLINRVTIPSGDLTIRGTCYLSSDFEIISIDGSFALGEGSSVYIADVSKPTFDFVGSYNNYGNVYCNKIFTDLVPEQLLFGGFGRTYIGQVNSTTLTIPESVKAQVTINWLIESVLYVPSAVKDSVKVIRKTSDSEIIYT